jgi:hypothetical protein
MTGSREGFIAGICLHLYQLAFVTAIIADGEPWSSPSRRAPSKVDLDAGPSSCRGHKMFLTGLDVWSGMMGTGEPFGPKTLARSAGYLTVGGLGALALTIPLFGVLSYLASPLLPLLLAWFAVGAVLPFVRPGRTARMYLFGNLGVLAATVSVFLGASIRLAVAHAEPDPTVAAPLYLGLVLAGLVLGIVLGARWR